MTDHPALRVLLADTAEQVEMYAAAFESAGHAAIQVNDGPAALAAAERHRPDAIVTEVRLPLIDGWDVCRRLKVNPATAHIPVIVLTTGPFDAASAALQSTGAAACRSKPCDPLEVLDMVRTMVSRSTV